MQEKIVPTWDTLYIRKSFLILNICTCVTKVACQWMNFSQAFKPKTWAPSWGVYVNTESGMCERGKLASPSQAFKVALYSKTCLAITFNWGNFCRARICFFEPCFVPKLFILWRTTLKSIHELHLSCNLLLYSMRCPCKHPDFNVTNWLPPAMADNCHPRQNLLQFLSHLNPRC